MFVSGNLVQTNDHILRPVLENAFFTERLAWAGNLIWKIKASFFALYNERPWKNAHEKGTDRLTSRLYASAQRANALKTLNLVSPLSITSCYFGKNIVFTISWFILEFFFWIPDFFFNPRILPSRTPTNHPMILLDILGLAKANSMQNLSELPKPIFFWIFCVKTKNLTNFKHNSTILGDFLGFGTIFWILKDFLISNVFEKCNVQKFVALLYDIQTPWN